ncbi:MAG: hypothetical protein EA341_13175 [Mongoliibacter sp.]|uniref:hypothetical protein n=1 Tax=Mongoliibacter sp. TaxID=2022438 RepID=UPI0012F4656F|nr:hypothetical protein [Mongoliibacter sp.]TVP47014.1 MAG: hypothetical protein EA341_13175 [Mongoliibacter sp.]
MVSLLSLFISFSLWILPIQNEVKFVYLKEKPEDLSNVLVFQKEGNDIYDRAEKILIDAEKDLKAHALSKNQNRVEVFIVEQSHGVLPTESQIGKKGYVTLWVSFKKT